MSDIFDEVDEEVAKDKWSKRSGWLVPSLWAIAIAIIGYTAFVQLYSIPRSNAQTEARTADFEAARAALEGGQYADAVDAFTALADDQKAAPLAAHFLARSQVEGRGDLSAASDILSSVAVGSPTDPLARLARVKAAYLKADTVALAELEVLLGDLPQEDSAFGALALELLAAKAFAEGDLERARRDFGFLRFAPSAPQGVARRAEAAVTVIQAMQAEGSDTGGE
ncbi:MAG: tetratricopeptide repeat protein [Pseudomonadota bacterium]